MKLIHRSMIGVVLLMGIALNGCSVHKPQPIELPTQIPDAFGEQYEPGPPIERWWETFKDPKLNALMEEAFSENLDLAQAYARLDQLDALYRVTAAAQYPFLNIEGESSWEETPSFFDDTSGNSYRLSLAAGFELDLWQKLKSRTRGANLDREASKEEIMALYLSLSAQLVDFYYLAVEQRAQLELTDQTIESFADTVERVKRRYREGVVPPLDVYQARQNLAAAKAQRPVFESNLAVAEHALAVLLGRYPDRETAGDVVKLPESPVAFPAGLPSEVLTRRPDIQAAFTRVQASDARVAAAIADRFPAFNLLGNYGTSRTAFGSDHISGAFWNFLVGLTQPLIDGGRRKAEVDRTRAVFMENVARYQKTVLTAFQEVEDALARNRATEERIAHLEGQVFASESSLRLSLERYMQGLSDYLPILTEQVIYFTARSNLLDARRQLISDRISLARALGGEWMEDEMENRLMANHNEEEDL